MFVVGLLPFAAVRVLLAATGSVQSFQFFGVYCATTSMIRVDGRLRCCSPASFRFFVHCVVMVRVVLYSLPCCFTTSIRLQRVFFVIRPVYLTSLLANNMPKITFVALPKYESFRDTTGYVTANASRQRSTSLVFPSSLTLPSFHPILFFAFDSPKAIVTIHYTYIQIPPTYVVQSTDILYPAIIGDNQLPTLL